jgi:hypothetical protein
MVTVKMTAYILKFAALELAACSCKLQAAWLQVARMLLAKLHALRAATCAQAAQVAQVAQAVVCRAVGCNGNFL